MVTMKITFTCSQKRTFTVFNFVTILAFFYKTFATRRVAIKCPFQFSREQKIQLILSQILCLFIVLLLFYLFEKNDIYIL
jgi:hypothetical protein